MHPKIEELHDICAAAITMLCSEHGDWVQLEEKLDTMRDANGELDFGIGTNIEWFMDEHDTHSNYAAAMSIVYSVWLDSSVHVCSELRVKVREAIDAAAEELGYE